MPLLAGVQSKYACLKIDDDSSSSESESKNSVASRAGRKEATNKEQGKANNGNVKTASGALLVHVVKPKPKNRSKKNKFLQKREEAHIPEDGLFAEPEEDFMSAAEKKFRKDLDQAIRNSRESSSKVAFSAESDDNKDITKLMDFYHKKYDEAVKINERQAEELAKWQGDAEKYRTRYKKICDIFHDAELCEKGQIVAELTRSRRVEAELGEQLGALRGELERARSKIRDLEAKLRQLDPHYKEQNSAT